MIKKTSKTKRTAKKKTKPEVKKVSNTAKKRPVSKFVKKKTTTKKTTLGRKAGAIEKPKLKKTINREKEKQKRSSSF